jgi:hypothetical protein
VFPFYLGHGASCRWLASGILGLQCRITAVVVEVVGNIGYAVVIVADDE